MPWCSLASGKLVFQVLQEKVGKVPFNLSLHVPPARWYPLAAQSGIVWGFIYGRVLYSLG